MPGDVGDRTLPPDQLAEMVRVVRPGWHLQEASLADSGWTSLYHLVVETDAGRRRCVLKASPGDDRRDGVDTEARIQAIVDDHTDIPVPTVLGVVDAHDNLRTPYFLMEWLPGETLSRLESSSLPSGTLRRIARETGRHLGQLHDLDTGLDAFGERVDHERSEPLRGESPSSDPARLFVADGYQRWPAQLRDWFEEDCRALEASRFDDLGPALRAEQRRRLDALPETFTPVLGRTDHHWGNRLVDREAGTLEGVLDWGETPAVARGLSLAYAEEGLATKRWKALPEVPDRRPLLREALLAGYREQTTVPRNFDTQRACYRLNLLIRDLTRFEERIGSAASSIPEARIEEAAGEYRAVARTELNRGRP